MNDVLHEIHEAVMEGNSATVHTKIEEAVAAGLPAHAMIDTMSQAMAEVGSLFESGEYFVPEMLIAARAMQSGMRQLKPFLVEADVKAAGVVVAGTVKGDLHEIGKNLVCMMLECAGFRVIDLGMDVSPDKFVQAVREEHPDVMAMSALLTTTMPNMGKTIEALRQAGVRGQVKVLVGGAPLTEAYAHALGADGYAKDASQAVKVAKSFLVKA